MAKLKNVTNEELRAANDAIDVANLWDLANRIEKLYCDEIENPLEIASSFLAISRSAADVASKIMLKAKHQELKAEIAKMKG